MLLLISHGKVIDKIILCPSSTETLLTSPNLIRGKELGVSDVIHADFSLISKQLGMDLGRICECLDQLYNINNPSGMPTVASLPPEWLAKCTNNELLSLLREAHRIWPGLLSYQAEMLAQDFKQLLDWPWPDRALDGVSARYIMRIVVLCAATVLVSGDSTCIQSLGPVIPQLLTVPCPGIPSLHYELLRFHSNLVIGPSLDRDRLWSALTSASSASEDAIPTHSMPVSSGKEHATRESEFKVQVPEGEEEGEGEGEGTMRMS